MPKASRLSAPIWLEIVIIRGQSESSRLGYGMQQGSGTFDTFFLFKKVNKIKKFTIGEQIFIKVPSS